MNNSSTPKREELQPTAPVEAVVQQRKTLAGVMLAGFVLAGGWWSIQFVGQSNENGRVALAEIKNGINPNTATWHELAQLPGLGESAGRAIVSYREGRIRTATQPVFKSAADLEPVPGIGPRTIERIARHLYFGASRATTTRPSF